MSDPYADLIPSQDDPYADIPYDDDPYADIPYDDDPYADIPYDNVLPTGPIGIAALETWEDVKQGVGRVAQGAVGAVASIPEALGIVAHRLGGGRDTQGRPIATEDVELYRSGQAMRRFGQSLFPVDEGRPKKFRVDTLGQAVGSTLGFIGTGVAGRLARLPVAGTVAATGAAAGGVDGYADAKAHGASEDVAWMSFLVNAGVGTTEAVPIAKWLDRANRASNGAIRRAMIEGTEEAIQEAVQAVSQNAFARGTYDPQRPWLQGAGEGAAAGFTVGALFSTLFPGRERGQPSQAATASPRPSQPTPPAPPPAPPPGSPGLPPGAQLVGPPGIQIALDDPETPALVGPVAVFRGAKGQDIRYALGEATLDAVKTLVFRTHPGAEFLAVEGEETFQGEPSPIKAPNAQEMAEAESDQAAFDEDRSLKAAEQAAAQADLAAMQEEDPFEDLAPKQKPGRSGDAREETREEQPAQPPGAPVQDQPTEKPKKVKVGRGSTWARMFNAETEQFGEDILSWIADNGGMMSATEARKRKGKDWWKQNKSLYDDAPRQFAAPHHRAIYGGQQLPDQVAQAAFRAGKLPDGTERELWMAIDQASRGRKGNKANAKREEDWLKAEVEQHEAWLKATESGDVRVSVDQLKVGDMMEVDDHQVEVVAVDPDSGDVTLQNGRMFGTRVVGPGQTIYVEKYDPAADEDWDIGQDETQEPPAAPPAEPTGAAPAPAAPPTPVPTPKPAQIPPRVLEQVQQAVQALQAVVDEAARIRKTLAQFGDPERYVQDLLRNQGVRINSARQVLAEFRKMAPSNGVDAEQVIASMGGEPTLPGQEDSGSGFKLDAPEYPEEMKAREAAEAARAQAAAAQAAAKAELAQRAARRLTGTTGDLGQGDLLAGPQDLWAPPLPINLVVPTTPEATAAALLDEAANTPTADEQAGLAHQRLAMDGVSAMPLAEARRWALDNVRGLVTNSATGMVIDVARTGIEKVTSNSAVRKSVSVPAHLAALSQLPILLRDAQLVESRPAEKRKDSINRIHRMAAPLRFGDQVFRVLTTIREAIDPKGNRFYTFEVAEIEVPAAKERATVMPEGTPSATTAGGVKVPQGSSTVKLAGIRINPKAAGESGFILNPAQLMADLLVAGARVLRSIGQWTASKSQWISAMVKRFGERIRKHLDAVWIRLARIQNQQANNVGPEAQGHLNNVETLAGKTNIPPEEHPLYPPDVVAAGKPSILTRLSPTSVQIQRLGGQALLQAKQRRDIVEATAAAAVKAQSDNLWSQLVDSARKAHPLKGWHLPQWIIGTPRAREFKNKALHIAARLNATGRDPGGNFVFTDFVMRAGAMSTREFSAGKHTVGDEIVLQDPDTGMEDRLVIGQLVTPPDGRIFYQLHRHMPASVQAEIYAHYAQAYPEMIWFLDMFIDPALASTRQTINGVQVPVFNRFSAAAMMADGHDEFHPLEAYTPDVLVTRSLLNTIRSAMSFSGGSRSPGRRYKSGQSRERGHVRDLLSAFNMRTWQMLAEKSRKAWMQDMLKAARPIQRNVIPEGWERVETGMEHLWQAVKRLRHWRSPESWRPLKQSEIDDLDVVEEGLKPNERIVRKDGRLFLATKLYPETEARMTERGVLADEEREYRAFFGEALRMRGRQLMIPTALREQIERRHQAQVIHGALYRLGAWAVRNSTQLFLVMPLTYVSNVLTNDLFTLEAAVRSALAGTLKLMSSEAPNQQKPGSNRGPTNKEQAAVQLRFARELMVAEFYKWFPGLRRLVDRSYRDTVDAVLPDNIFADQTALADLKVRIDQDPMSYLRQGEIGAAALQAIRYGNIDIRSKQRMAYAWLRAMAVSNARRAGLRGDALRRAVESYLKNPPVDERAKAVEIAGFELLNYADTPAWLQEFASNDYNRLLLPFPRFGYHYLAKNARRASALKDLMAKVPQRQRADAFADFIAFLLFPAGGAGILAAVVTGWDDDEEARKLFGTSRIKSTDAQGNIVSKPIDRSLITVNRINLSAWARQLGLGDPARETDFWLRVRNYPVIAMAGAAALAWDDAKRFGAKEGINSYLSAITDLGADFFSVGMAARVPDKVLQTLRDSSRGGNPPPMITDPYGARVPVMAYVVDQTLDSFVPGTRQADLLIRWLDPVHRRRTPSKELKFEPSVWDAARVGHWTGLMDRLLAGRPGTTASTLPPEGQVRRGRVTPQTYPIEQRMFELGGFNIRPIDRRRYERALDAAR